jgi:hypothetical protein
MSADRTDAHELPTPRSMARTSFRVHVWCKVVPPREGCRSRRSDCRRPRRCAPGADEMALRQLRLATDRIHRGRMPHATGQTANWHGLKSVPRFEACCVLGFFSEGQRERLRTELQPLVRRALVGSGACSILVAPPPAPRRGQVDRDMRKDLFAVAPSSSLCSTAGCLAQWPRRSWSSLRIGMSMDDAPAVAFATEHHSYPQLLFRSLRATSNASVDDLLLDQIGKAAFN